MKQTPELTAIQEEMQPGRISATGFLGDDARQLADILTADAATVEALGVSHQRISEAMRRLTNIGRGGFGTPVQVDCYEITVEDFMGRIACPFRDGRVIKRTTTVRDLERGTELSWTDLAMHLIGRHGFYQGEGSPHRLDPGELVRFLRLEPEGGR